jgi:hypothetical protein
MKLFIYLILSYFSLIMCFTLAFNNNVMLGFISLLFYFFFSVTYCRKTFFPYIVNWFGAISNNHYFMEKIKNDDSMNGYIEYLGNFYIKAQKDNDEFRFIVKKVSYISFIILPVFFYAHYFLYKQIKRMSK